MEAVSINFADCKTKIKNNLTKFTFDCCFEKGVPVKCFIQWMYVIEKVNKKLKNLSFLLKKLQRTLHLYVRNICPSTLKRIRFIKYCIKYLSISELYSS